MPRYRVTIVRSTVETIEALNPYMAAASLVERYGPGATVTDVRPAAGRDVGSSPPKKNTTKKTAAKKRKPLSPEARARLAENLTKARAARARKFKAAKKRTGKKATATKKAGKNATKQG